jgi:hypothetical protein
MHAEAIKHHLQHLAWTAKRLGDLVHVDARSNVTVPVDGNGSPMSADAVAAEIATLRTQLREEHELVQRELDGES